MTLLSTHRTWGLDTVKDDQVWRQHAKCGPSSAEWFWFTSRTGRNGRAKKLSVDNQRAIQLCAVCPVRRDCLAAERAQPSQHPHIAAGRLWPGGRVL